MQIAFVRTGEPKDRVHVRRDDGTEAAWRWGAAGPPHDLMHWVVERELGMADGFWGLVAAGAEPADLDGGPQLMQAEAVVNSIQHGMTMDPPWTDLECLRWAATWCEQARTELPAGLDVGRYGALRATAEKWVARYRALGPREAISVTFPSHP
jgi:hypothetical protein